MITAICAALCASIIACFVYAIIDWPHAKIQPRTGGVCKEHGYCIHVLWDKKNNLWKCTTPDCMRLCHIIEDEGNTTRQDDGGSNTMNENDNLKGT
jgi:hypothetical protein